MGQVHAWCICHTLLQNGSISPKWLLCNDSSNQQETKGVKNEEDGFCCKRWESVSCSLRIAISRAIIVRSSWSPWSMDFRWSTRHDGVLGERKWCLYMILLLICYQKHLSVNLCFNEVECLQCRKSTRKQTVYYHVNGSLMMQELCKFLKDLIIYPWWPNQAYVEPWNTHTPNSFRVAILE